MVYAEHVPALREQLGDVFHLWSNAGGTLRVIDDERPSRSHPLGPDLDARGRALAVAASTAPVNRVATAAGSPSANPTFVADLDDVTWVADDGVRYMRPRSSCTTRRSSTGTRTHRPRERVAAADARDAGLAARAGTPGLPDHPWQCRLDAERAGLSGHAVRWWMQ